MTKRVSSSVEKRSSQLGTKEPPRKHNSPNTNSLFLIDGKSPVHPDPQLTNKTIQLMSNGPGRHRSDDMKGLLLALIDEIYPPLICPECYQTSYGRSEADRHFRELHRGRKVFQCVSFTCEQIYSTKAGLRYHLEHAHQVTPSLAHKTNILSLQSIPPQKRPRQITKNAQGRNVGQLSDQVQRTLNNIYPTTTCPSCKQIFNKKTHVITHLVDSHHGAEPYQCFVMDCKHSKKYATREGLLYHLVTYHNDQ